MKSILIIIVCIFWSTAHAVPFTYIQDSSLIGKSPVMMAYGAQAMIRL